MNVGMGAMETVNAPFQMAGEAVRGAGEGEPLQIATASDPRGFRAPSIAQRLMPSLKTPKPPADIFQKSYQGLEGLMQPNLQAGKDVVTGEPDLAAQVGGTGIALGMMPPKAGTLSNIGPEAEMTGGSLKPTLPVIQPTGKVGDPYALFEGNITGGEGPGLSQYKLYGEHPRSGGNFNPDQLKEMGIPIKGRSPTPAAINSEPIGLDDIKEPSVIPMGGEKQKFTGASQVPPDSNAPPPKPPVPETDPIQEVKNYIGGKYSNYAKQPGAIPQIADYIQEKSQMMANQQMGATPLQARQVGHDGMRAIGQYAMDHDIVGPTVGLRGMRARNTELLNQAGEKLGALRKEADSLHQPTVTPIDTLQAIKAKLDPKYARGPYSGEAGQYGKALEAVEDSDASFSGAAKMATDLNQAANKALRLQQPHGPYTDVANTISQINNDRIRQLLGPQKAAEYDAALNEYGVNKKISEFLKRKEAGEVKRMGPGSMISNMFQKGMDEFGNRTISKAANKVSGAVIKNPGIAKSLPSLFKEFIHQVDLPDEPGTAGMAHGGVIPEMNDFLTQKYSQKKETSK